MIIFDRSIMNSLVFKYCNVESQRGSTISGGQNCYSEMRLESIVLCVNCPSSEVLLEGMLRREFTADYDLN